MGRADRNEGWLQVEVDGLVDGNGGDGHGN